MTIKQLFKMVESANSFNELVGDRKKNYIGLKQDIFYLKDKNDNSRFYTLSEFKKALNYQSYKNEIEIIMNAEFTQSEEYKNYFNFNNYELGIFEER